MSCERRFALLLTLLLASLPSAASAQRYVEAFRSGMPRLPPAPPPGPLHGISVATDGDVLLVGQPGVGGNLVIFYDARTGDWRGSLMGREGFGAAVGIAGSTVVVGAPEADRGVGVISVFRFASGLLELQYEYHPTLVSPGARFGAALAMVDADTVIVGAPGASAAFKIELGATAGSLANVCYDTGVPGMGGAIATSGGAYALGSRDLSAPWPVRVGMVDTFACPTVIPNPGAENGFGSAVAMDEPYLVIGSPDAGRVSVFGFTSDAAVSPIRAYGDGTVVGLGDALAIVDDDVFAGAPIELGEGGDLGVVVHLRIGLPGLHRVVRTTLASPALQLGTALAAAPGLVVAGAPGYAVGGDPGDALAFRWEPPRSCTRPEDCPRGEPCVDGVCCEHACGGPDDCVSCDVSGNPGWCLPEPSETSCVAGPACPGTCDGDTTLCSPIEPCDVDGGQADAALLLDAWRADTGAAPAVDTGPASMDGGLRDDAGSLDGVRFSGGGGCRCGVAGAGSRSAGSRGLALWLAAIVLGARRGRRRAAQHPAD